MKSTAGQSSKSSKDRIKAAPSSPAIDCDCDLLRNVRIEGQVASLARKKPRRPTVRPGTGAMGFKSFQLHQDDQTTRNL
jgi:hypothetical protein